MKTAISMCATIGLLTGSCTYAQAPAAQPHGAAGSPRCGTVETWPGTHWAETEPAAAGWNEATLDLARSYWEEIDSAAVMVVHRGNAIAQWGKVDERFTAQSMRKALVNSLVGLLVVDGHISLDDTLADLGIDDDPPLTPGERQATLEHLLLSRSGIFHSALYEVGNWRRTRQQLAARKLAQGGFSPGEYWVYNNWDFNAVGTIVEQYGGPIGEQFATRIAGPIGMEDFVPQHVEYTDRNHPAEQQFGNRSDHRAYVFDISTRDLARYGLLYLGCGQWDGRQVLSQEWVLASTTGIATRIGRGPDEQSTGFGDYGYLWQIDRPGSRRYGGLPLRDPFYIGSGARGHLLLVFPALDLVIAHQVATRGGVGVEAQLHRARAGTPEVTDGEIEQLVRAIIAAHPQAAQSFGDL